MASIESSTNPTEPHHADIAQQLSNQVYIMLVTGLFSGTGGFELAFMQAGFETNLLVEIDPAASAVLAAKFPQVGVESDIREIPNLPPDTEIVTAGFPCQNLSMAGDKSGINGTQSTVVEELMRLLEKHPVPWVVIENVYFMLYLKRGEGMKQLLDRLESIGYNWAYRVVDSRCFGLPQRRRRVFIVASNEGDPRDVLLADDVGKIDWPEAVLSQPIGFYWTEGRSGHGLTGDAIPPLKSGSALNIPSPPAILLPEGRVVTPSIEAAERMQGFPAGWTSVLKSDKDTRRRWRLVGNAVPVPVAKWIAERLRKPAQYIAETDSLLNSNKRWPKAAWNMGDGRMTSTVSEYPVKKRRGRISAFATHCWPDLSKRALNGFVSRAHGSTLSYPDGFLESLEARLQKLV